MTPDTLRQAALSAAQGISATEAVDAFVEQFARQKPARIRDAEYQALLATPEYMASCCAAFAVAISKPIESLTDNEKKQAMLNLALKEEKKDDQSLLWAMCCARDGGIAEEGTHRKRPNV